MENTEKNIETINNDSNVNSTPSVNNETKNVETVNNVPTVNNEPYDNNVSIHNNESKNDENLNIVSSNGIAFTMVDLDVMQQKTEFDIFLNIFKNEDSFNSVIAKLNYNIDEKTLSKVNSLINILLKKDEKHNIPLKIIMDDMHKILLDGKLNLQDIPSIINIMTTILNLNFKNVHFNIDINTVNTFIKLLLNILIAEKIVKIDETQENIDKLLDSSLLLLNTTINLSNVKCSCFPFLCK
jgi:hypothetical protein